MNSSLMKSSWMKSSWMKSSWTNSAPMKFSWRAQLRTGGLALSTILALGSISLAAELRTNLPADPAMVDPITYSEVVAGDVIRNMYESFTTIDGSGKVVPALAESWEPLAGNLGFRVKLRKGVKFHSGREFTAKDVKFSFEQLLVPTNKAGLNAPYLNVVVGADKVKDGSAKELAGIQIIDDHTVEIAFSTADVLFPLYPIFMMDSGVIAEAGPTWATKVSAGTGPFKFDSWARGQHVRLTAHEGYWRGKPKLDSIRFLIVPDANTTMSMYETGALDVMRAPPALNRRIMGDNSLKSQLLAVPAAQVRYLAMNAELYAPFKDKKVREAFCISLNQDEMIPGLHEGAAVAFYGAITPGVAGASPGLKPIKADLARARTLLGEAGFAKGTGMPPLKISDLEPNKTQALYLAAQFQEIGAPVEVEILERGAMLKSMNSRQLPLYTWGWSAGYPDGLYFLQDLWYGPSAYNKGYKNAAYDALINKAKVTANADDRYKIYQEAENLLLADWGMCPLPLVVQIVLVKPTVKDVKLTPFRLQPYWDVSVTK
jgi:oligopeptide transport system substrate-binding protein